MAFYTLQMKPIANESLVIMVSIDARGIWNWRDYNQTMAAVADTGFSFLTHICISSNKRCANFRESFARFSRVFASFRELFATFGARNGPKMIQNGPKRRKTVRKRCENGPGMASASVLSHMYGGGGRCTACFLLILNGKEFRHVWFKYKIQI